MGWVGSLRVVTANWWLSFVSGARRTASRRCCLMGAPGGVLDASLDWSPRAPPGPCIFGRIPQRRIVLWWVALGARTVCRYHSSSRIHRITTHWVWIAVVGRRGNRDALRSWATALLGRAMEVSRSCQGRVRMGGCRSAWQMEDPSGNWGCPAMVAIVATGAATTPFFLHNEFASNNGTGTILVTSSWWYLNCMICFMMLAVWDILAEALG